MRCTFKTVFYVNGSKDRNGIVPIMGRVTINGTIAQFSCKQSVTKAICDILAVFLQSKSIKLVVMTLKELLDSLSFDEIAPYLIIRHYTRDYASGDLVAEIAACCLWHTSFWGYLPYQREESFRKITTDNLKLICTAKFYKNKFSEIIPSKREMMQIPSFRNEIRSDYEKKI